MRGHKTCPSESPNWRASIVTARPSIATFASQFICFYSPHGIEKTAYGFSPVTLTLTARRFAGGIDHSLSLLSSFRSGSEIPGWPARLQAAAAEFEKSV